MGYLKAASEFRAVKWSRHLAGPYPTALHPVSSRLLISSSKHRQLWGCAYHQRYSQDSGKRHFYEHQRFCSPQVRSRPSRQFRPQPTIFDDHRPWWSQPSNLPPKTNNNLSENSTPFDNVWEKEADRTRRKMDHIKREIEKDPFGALFGRRLEPLKSFEKFDDTFTSLCRSIFGLVTKPASPANAKVRPTTAAATPRETPDMMKRSSSTDLKDTSGSDVPSAKANTTRYEFDPISGRMVSKEAKNADAAEMTGGGNIPLGPEAKPTFGQETTGYMSPVHLKPNDSSAPEIPTQMKSDEGLVEKIGPTKNEESQDISSLVDASTTKSESTGRLRPSEGGSSDSPEATYPSERVELESAQHRALSESPENDSIKPLLRHDAQEQVLQSRSHSDGCDPALGLNDSSVSDRINSSDPAKLDQSIDNSTKLQNASREQEEDLESLSASGIRASYLKMDADMKTQALQDSNELGDMSDTVKRHQLEESVKIGTAQSQKAPDEASPSTLDGLEALNSQASALKAVNTSSSLASDEVPFAAQPPGPTPLIAQGIPSQGLVETYRVLAFDPITLRVTEAETSSSFHAPEEPLHPTEILSRLNNPARFLPYFERLNNDGFEIVSGGGDILVFKKIRDSRKVTSEEGHDEVTASATVANKPAPLSSFASNDGNLKSNTVLAQTQNAKASRGEHASQERKSARILRRMLLGGVATAGTCYAVGVVTEYFRTGGEDGRGVDGFTAFESDRRRRE
ncbi:uncharacterized protein BO97DRAFT_404813 [Aspergillus homomorphus CBS 101889]|uniref:Serine-threonine rich protein n=1 Tax=Aspergillus homomorphus (strain CBS 101889) TaxID=1450537 RepID=A0A395I0T7_ASPHC|nr:hypothetical protein BO97DRAFT_404813 [Aspergillus homomorphus CBS 101889]RAL13680.1 hypothetical protein BO97DRAFT_404813 [Aspergillus homomorphus CBS 101889]